MIQKQFLLLPLSFFLTKTGCVYFMSQYNMTADALKIRCWPIVLKLINNSLRKYKGNYCLMSVWKLDETLLSICILNFSFKNDFQLSSRCFIWWWNTASHVWYITCGILIDPFEKDDAVPWANSFAGIIYQISYGFTFIELAHGSAYKPWST